MKFDNFSKILFDIIMFVLLCVVYCAQSTTMSIHEYIGLSMFLFFIVHLFYNRKWIVNVGKKYFNKEMNFRIKLNYIIDCLLIIVFILIGISGIIISEVIFKFSKVSLKVMQTARVMHTAVASISIILIAIHLGLHWNMIINTVKTKIKLPFNIVKIIALLLLSIILCIGIYGDITVQKQLKQSQTRIRPQYETALTLFMKSSILLTGSSAHERMNNLENNNLEFERMNERTNVERRGSSAHERMNRMENDNQEFVRMNERTNMERHGPTASPFNAKSLIVSICNFSAFILVSSLIIFFIDQRIRKIKKRTIIKNVS